MYLIDSILHAFIILKWLKIAHNWPFTHLNKKMKKKSKEKVSDKNELSSSWQYECLECKFSFPFTEGEKWKKKKKTNEPEPRGKSHWTSSCMNSIREICGDIDEWTFNHFPLGLRDKWNLSRRKFYFQFSDSVVYGLSTQWTTATPTATAQTNNSHSNNSKWRGCVQQQQRVCVCKRERVNFIARFFVPMCRLYLFVR